MSQSPSEFDVSSLNVAQQCDCWRHHSSSRVCVRAGRREPWERGWILRRWYARAILSRYQSATWKVFVYGLVHTQFLLFSNTLICPRNFCELVILCVMLLCPNNLVHCYRNVRETQWTPNKPKARRLWPIYRLTFVSVNTTSNSSPTQSQTKIVGTL